MIDSLILNETVMGILVYRKELGRLIIIIIIIMISAISSFLRMA